MALLVVIGQMGHCRTDRLDVIRGHQRAAAEAGGVFGEGSQSCVAISIMVKDPDHVGACKLHYCDIGDYLSREEKLEIVEGFGSIDGMNWQELIPNTAGDWINQRDPAFDRFIPLGNKDDASDKTIFGTYSLGVVTNRDPWAYNASQSALEANVRRMIDAFNKDSARYASLSQG